MSNPFQSPEPLESLGENLAHSGDTWKDVAVRWERLRLPYNLAVGVAGLCGLLIVPVSANPGEVIAGALGWAIGANVCYLLGPIVQMYALWFAEGPHTDSAPSPAESLAGSLLFTWVFFAVGTGFSVLLTLATVAISGTSWR